MEKNYEGDSYVDASGKLRLPGEQYVDYAGILRMPGEQYVDASGVLRMPGEQYVDASGVLRMPGEQYVDSSGVLRMPAVKQEDSIEYNPINNISIPSNNENKYASYSGPIDKEFTLGKLLVRIFLLLIFVGAAFTSFWEEVVVPIYSGNYMTWLLLPIIISSIISSIICILLYKKYLHIFGYFVRNITSIVPNLIYFLALTKFNSDSESLAAVIIFSIAISLITAYISLIVTKLFRKKFNRG